MNHPQQVSIQVVSHRTPPCVIPNSKLRLIHVVCSRRGHVGAVSGSSALRETRPSATGGASSTFRHPLPVGGSSYLKSATCHCRGTLCLRYASKHCKSSSLVRPLLLLSECPFSSRVNHPNRDRRPGENTQHSHTLFVPPDHAQP